VVSLRPVLSSSLERRGGKPLRCLHERAGQSEEKKLGKRATQHRPALDEHAFAVVAAEPIGTPPPVRTGPVGEAPSMAFKQTIEQSSTPFAL